MRRADSVLLVLGLCVTVLAQAQSTAPAPDAGTPSYLLRLERVHERQGVCVLLRGNGDYHLERHSPQKIRIFEGSVDADELRNIVHIVSGDQLFSLEQKQIADLMMKSDDDQVILAIQRPGSSQQLSFPDSASREPYRESLDPLLKWFEGLNKRKGPELSEEAARNNCLPPSRLDFAQRSNSSAGPPAATASASSTSANAPTPENTYVLQRLDNRIARDRVEMTCLIVSTSGTYHLVKQSRGIGSKDITTVALDGALSQAELTSLRGILDTPELRNEPSPPATAGEREAAITLAASSWMAQLSIPRDGKVQKVVVWKALRFLGAAQTRLTEDHDSKLLQPLSEWLQSHIDGSKAVPSPHPANGKCDP